jgi:rubrerythrin
MELTKFGALVQFALELEQGAAAFYNEAEKQAGGDSLKAVFSSLLSDCRKNAQRLERIRREDVNEMLLESVHGIHGETYSMPEVSAAGTGGLVAAAKVTEETLARYYRDIVSKLSLPDAARSFSRLADSHARNEARVADLAPQ